MTCAASVADGDALSARTERSNQKDAVTQIERDRRRRNLPGRLPGRGRTEVLGSGQNLDDGGQRYVLERGQRRNRIAAIRDLVGGGAERMRARCTPRQSDGERAVGTRARRVRGFGQGSAVVVRRRVRMSVARSSCRAGSVVLLHKRRGRRRHRETGCGTGTERCERKEGQEGSTPSRPASAQPAEDVGRSTHEAELKGGPRSRVNDPHCHQIEKIREHSILSPTFNVSERSWTLSPRFFETHRSHLSEIRRQSPVSAAS